MSANARLSAQEYYRFGFNLHSLQIAMNDPYRNMSIRHPLLTRCELETWPWWLEELANAEIEKREIFVAAYSKNTMQMKAVESKSMMQFQSQIS